MKKLIAGALILGLVAANALAELKGPKNGFYIWGISPQKITIPGTSWTNELTDLRVKCIYVNSGMSGVSCQVFSPMITNLCVAPGQSAFGSGETCGQPVLYKNSTTAGYGQLYVGAYTHCNPTNGLMDIVLLQPQAGGGLNISTVYVGNAYVDTNHFFTQGGSCALYDKDGLWTGKARSLVVAGYNAPMSGVTSGFATDANGDGNFTSPEDTSNGFKASFVGGSGNFSGPMLYSNVMAGGTAYLGTVNGTNYSSTYGIWQLKTSGGVTNTARTLFYQDSLTNALCQPVPLNMSSAWARQGPMLAFNERATDHGTVLDMFAPMRNVSNNVYAVTNYVGIVRLHDENGNGNAMDPGEAEVWCRFGNYSTGPWSWAPWDVDANGIQRSNKCWQVATGTAKGIFPIGVVQGSDGSKSLIVCYNSEYEFAGTDDTALMYAALGINPDGSFSTNAQCIASFKRPTGALYNGIFTNANVGAWFSLIDVIADKPAPYGTQILFK